MENINLKKEAKWQEAQKSCGLNEETVSMAKEMGLNPLSLIQNIPTRKQPLKKPVHVWIREMYAERQANALNIKVSKADVDKLGE